METKQEICDEKSRNFWTFSSHVSGNKTRYFWWDIRTFFGKMWGHLPAMFWRQNQIVLMRCQDIFSPVSDNKTGCFWWEIETLTVVLWQQNLICWTRCWSIFQLWLGQQNYIFFKMRSQDIFQVIVATKPDIFMRCRDISCWVCGNTIRHFGWAIFVETNDKWQMSRHFNPVSGNKSRHFDEMSGHSQPCFWQQNQTFPEFMVTNPGI